MIEKMSWMQRFMFASLWYTMKSGNPIDCLILSNKIIIRQNVWFDEKYYGIKLLNASS
jgi:hypothetical protein